GEMDHFPDVGAQSVQREPRAGVLRSLQRFDQRGEARAVHVADLREIDDDPGPAPLTDLPKQRQTQVRRRGEVDVPRDVEDGDRVEVARGDLHGWFTSTVPGGARDTKELDEPETIAARSPAKFY